MASIRQHLADIYERNQNWKEAANVLVGIPLETGQKYAFHFLPKLLFLFLLPLQTDLMVSGHSYSGKSAM